MSSGELIVVFGPPVVGEMTVGRAVCIRQLVSPYSSRGLAVRFVEPYADLSSRLERNSGPDRLAIKPSKRDLVRSKAHVLEREAAFTMNTAPEVELPGQVVLSGHHHLRLDTTVLRPREAAARILAE